MALWVYLMAGLYGLAVIGLFLHGINSYFLIFAFLRNRKRETSCDAVQREEYWRRVGPGELPFVTIQVPIYNERNVIGRQLDALAALDYPRERYEVQILDDSSDETVAYVDERARWYRSRGVEMNHIRRGSRDGFKAGALAYGLRRARGSLVGIFDADFVPERDFLLRTVPFFEDPQVGFVQTRWGHINAGESFLTKAQSVGIDGHFSVEQAGRAWARYFMNFNGAAGVWRRQAIDDAGGWQSDTLTEDLDLSYRAQFKGWRAKYLLDTVTPAEVPADMNSFKSQQFRWAKGSIQSAIKNIGPLLRCDVSWWMKYQAMIHMTHYIVHPLMVLVAILSIPMLRHFPIAFGPNWLAVLVAMLLLSTCGPSALYGVSQRALYPSRWSRLFILPGLICFGTGIAVNNTRAVLEAAFGCKSAFVRTPKRGDAAIPGTLPRYTMPLTWTFGVELLLGFYCLVGVGIYFEAQRYVIGNFLLLYSIGFLLVATLSAEHVYRSSKRIRVARDFVD